MTIRESNTAVFTHHLLSLTRALAVRSIGFLIITSKKRPQLMKIHHEAPMDTSFAGLTADYPYRSWSSSFMDELGFEQLPIATITRSRRSSIQSSIHNSYPCTGDLEHPLI